MLKRDVKLQLTNQHDMETTVYLTYVSNATLLASHEQVSAMASHVPEAPRGRICTSATFGRAVGVADYTEYLFMFIWLFVYISCFDSE